MSKIEITSISFTEENNDVFKYLKTKGKGNKSNYLIGLIRRDMNGINGLSEENIRELIKQEVEKAIKNKPPERKNSEDLMSAVNDIFKF
jgi:hypothetical protein